MSTSFSGSTANLMGNNQIKVDDEYSRGFSLQGKKLKLDSAADVEEYVKVIEETKNLATVCLSGNTVGVEAAKSLAAAIKNKHSITEVDLHDCFTGRMKEEVPVAIEAFCKAFLELPNLRKVDFSDNAFGPIGAKAVFEYLSNATNLQELIINNNGLGPEGGKIIGEALVLCSQKCKSIGAKSSLKKVSIGRNRLENGSMEALGKAFEAHESLSDLSLYQNGIRPDGICTLSSSISKCVNLQYFDLQDNTFTEKGCRAFLEVLNHCNKLSNLNLGDCLLGPEGGYLILEAIFKNDVLCARLATLNLQYNEIDEKGGLSLAENIGKMTGLKELVLNGNNFKSKGKAANLILKNIGSAGNVTKVDEWDDMEADMDSDTEESDEAVDDERGASETKEEEDLTKRIEDLKL